MTEVNVTIKDGHVTIDIKGHANYDEHGKDIVCAGVTATTQAAILGLREISRQYPDFVKFKLKND